MRPQEKKLTGGGAAMFRGPILPYFPFSFFGLACSCTPFCFLEDVGLASFAWKLAFRIRERRKGRRQFLRRIYLVASAIWRFSTDVATLFFFLWLQTRDILTPCKNDAACAKQEFPTLISEIRRTTPAYG